jgi:TATA-box binding protein (TBP) (component of TFIID and TFIIIB)
MEMKDGGVSSAAMLYREKFPGLIYQCFRDPDQVLRLLSGDLVL